MKSVVFTVGRFNPVTKGHLSLFYNMQYLAGRSALRVFTTKTFDPIRNPLSVEQKLAFMKELFPRLPVSATEGVMSALHTLRQDGFTHAVMVVGDDRAADFTDLARDVNAGKTNCDIRMTVQPNQRVAGPSSATVARALAKNDDITGFADVMPTKDKTLIAKIYHAVRAGMEL